MSKPKAPKESAEQRKQRLESEARLAVQEARANADDLKSRKRFMTSRTRLAMRIFGARGRLSGAAQFAGAGSGTRGFGGGNAAGPGGSGGLVGGGLAGLGGFGGGLGYGSVNNNFIPGMVRNPNDPIVIGAGN
jgi:hypothetical protein